MPESEFNPEMQTREIFEVVEIPARGGLIYEIYFAKEEQAAQAVKDFWNALEKETSTVRGLRSGMLNPTKHQITSGDRTHPMKLSTSDTQEHPGKLFKVQFNGNTDALSGKGTESLRELGFIK